jgi:hypothetical protein
MALGFMILHHYDQLVLPLTRTAVSRISLEDGNRNFRVSDNCLLGFDGSCTFYISGLTQILH